MEKAVATNVANFPAARQLRISQAGIPHLTLHSHVWEKHARFALFSPTPPMHAQLVFLISLCTVGSYSACDHKPADKRVVHRDGEPDVINVDSKDAEMNSAMAQARKTTDTFLQTLAAPKPNQTDFSAKRPYPTKGGSSKEHIWISQLTYDGKLLHGTVGDEPVNIPNLKFGEPVSFSPSELSDWMYLEDGKVVGGATVRVLRERLPAGERAEFDRHLQFKQ